MIACDSLFRTHIAEYRPLLFIVSAHDCFLPAFPVQRHAQIGSYTDFFRSLSSRGTETKPNPAPEERKNPRNKPADDNDAKEYERIKQAEAAIPGALAGNWRDLRTVFEFAGICQENKTEYKDPSLAVLGEAKDSAASG